MRSLCGIVLLAGLSAAQDPLAAELAEAVDSETPGQRRKAARELAGREDVTLDQRIAGKLVYPDGSPVIGARLFIHGGDRGPWTLTATLRVGRIQLQGTRKGIRAGDSGVRIELEADR